MGKYIVHMEEIDSMLIKANFFQNRLEKRPAVAHRTAGLQTTGKTMIPRFDQHGGFVKGAERPLTVMESAAEAISD